MHVITFITSFWNLKKKQLVCTNTFWFRFSRSRFSTWACKAVNQNISSLFETLVYIKTYKQQLNLFQNFLITSSLIWPCCCKFSLTLIIILFKITNDTWRIWKRINVKKKRKRGFQYFTTHVGKCLRKSAWFKCSYIWKK